MKKDLPARKLRGVRSHVSLEVEFALPERCTMDNLGADGGRVGERTDHWIFNVEPRDAAAVLRAFRKIVSVLETETARGGRLRLKRKAKR